MADHTPDHTPGSTPDHMSEQTSRAFPERAHSAREIVSISRSEAHRAPAPLRDARRNLAQHITTAKETAADGLISTAERIRAEAYRIGDDELLRQAQNLSGQLERTAVYLHGHTLDQMGGDARQVVQNKPWQAVVIAFVVGIIFGRTIIRD